MLNQAFPLGADSNAFRIQLADSAATARSCSRAARGRRLAVGEPELLVNFRARGAEGAARVAEERGVSTASRCSSTRARNRFTYRAPGASTACGSKAVTFSPRAKSLQSTMGSTSDGALRASSIDGLRPPQWGNVELGSRQRPEPDCAGCKSDPRRKRRCCPISAAPNLRSCSFDAPLVLLASGIGGFAGAHMTLRA